MCSLASSFFHIYFSLALSQHGGSTYIKRGSSQLQAICQLGLETFLKTHKCTSKFRRHLSGQSN